jgi:mycoredoxin
MKGSNNLLCLEIPLSEDRGTINLNNIKMYGTKWCPDCFRAKQVLNKHNIPFIWYDIEQDEKACEYVEKVNGGFKSVPTIVFPDGSVLVEPSNSALERKLEEFKKIRSRKYPAILLFTSQDR